MKKKNRALVLKDIIFCDFRRGRIVCAQCGPSMMYYLETSETSENWPHTFPDSFIRKKG